MTKPRDLAESVNQLSIPGSRLEDGAISTVKIQDGAITESKLGPGAYQWVNVKSFGATGDGSTDDWSYINAAWEYCLANEVSLFFPAGTYVCIEKNFPFRQGGIPLTTLDCKNVTVFGEGPTTILKTVSNAGADVLQINGLANFHVRNLAIEAELLTQSGAGTNAISVTSSYDNLTFENIWIAPMPYVDAGSYGDGGKGLTVQEAVGGFCGSVTARNIFVRGCYYATGWDGLIETLLAGQSLIDVEFEAEDCYVGVAIAAAAPATPIAAGESLGMRFKGSVTNCQRDALVARCVGLELDLTVVTDKTAAQRRLNPQGQPWLATGSTAVESLFAVSTKYSRVSITGWKGECDYKARIGAGDNYYGGANLSYWTEQTSFDLAIGGSAGTADLAVEVFAGESVKNCRLAVTSSTTTSIPNEFLSNANSNLVVVDGSIQFTAAGAGAVTRSLDSKLGDNVSSSDFGIPTDFTDDGLNHTRLLDAAKAAIVAGVPLRIDGPILVSNTVNWDTRTSAYDNLDPTLPNGIGKFLSIVADNPGAGIFGNAQSFNATSKPIVNLCTQNRSVLRGLAFKLWQPSAIYNWTNFTNVTALRVLSTDRIEISGCSIGGLRRPNATDIGMGRALQFDDCMSCRVENCDIQYVSSRGIAYSNTQGNLRTGTSFDITACHISVGKPTAVSRDECAGLDTSGTQAWFINGCVFENYEKGRAIYLEGENNVVRDCWFEGNYDTIFPAGLFHCIRDNYGIGYNPALSYIEGWLNTAVAPGVLPQGVPSPVSLQNIDISYRNFYLKGTQLMGPISVRGSFFVNGPITTADNLSSVFDGANNLGSISTRWQNIYATNGTIITSDENEKVDIGEIDERVLKVWAKINFRQYKLKQAVEQKGDSARWHFGVVAQEIKAAFEAEGLDPFAYGILCHESWDENGVKQDRYGVRYDEALALECAYLRSRAG